MLNRCMSRQVPVAQWDLTTPPRLYEVQMCCAAAFFVGGSIPRLAWRLLGIGIRMCQELGLQCRALFGSQPHSHHELWKRCFWFVGLISERSLEMLIRKQDAVLHGYILGVGKRTTLWLA
jgi:hypothetical protein